MSLLPAPALPAVPNYPVANPHQAAIDYAKEQVLAELSSDKGYRAMAQSAGVDIWKKYNVDDPHGLAIVKGSCIIKGVTTDAFVPVTQLVGFRKRWDPNYVGGHIVERYSTHVFSFYAATKKIAIVAGRDVTGVSQAFGSGLRNERVLIIQVSVDTGIPEQADLVRGTVHFSGWLFEPQGDDIKASVVFKFGSNGAIPLRIGRMLASELPACIGHARDVFYKLGHPPYAQFLDGADDTTAIFQTVDISAHRDLAFTFTFTTKPHAAFEIIYDRKMYPRGINVTLDGQGNAVDADDNDNGKIRIRCFDVEPRPVTLKVTSRIPPKMTRMNTLQRIQSWSSAKFDAKDTRNAEAPVLPPMPIRV